MLKNSLQKTSPIARTCTVVMPGLFDVQSSERQSVFEQTVGLTELASFFSRAKREPFSSANVESVVFDLFGVVRDKSMDTPVAAASYLSDAGQPAQAWCLRADPVNLVPDRDHLVLMGPESLSLSQPEADQLVEDLNKLFSDDGWRFEACTPTRWYVHLPSDPLLRTYDLSQVRGHAIDDYLPAGPNGKQWHGIMNEVQMVLHTSVVNIERQAAGRLSISSVWFWGGGKTPDITQSRWSKLWSNESVSLGLAELSHTPRKDLPKNASEWLEAAISPGAHLLMLDDLQQAWQYDGVSVWAQRLREINDEWIAPLLIALRSGEITELSLCTCQGHRFTLTRAGLKRWWRRKKQLSDFYGQ